MQYGKFIRMLIVISAFFIGVSAAVGQFDPIAGPGGPPELTITTYQQTSGVTPGNQARLAIVIQVPDGWHINAHKPLDEYLIPTETALEPPEGFTLEGVVYPEPILASFSFSDDKLAV
ncbi:MAG: hypothetical protein U9Q79_03730, partial [Candidatus Hydrogenedentes bacterium]|nr:hypothetical protein [Candidatus Hydrogenedentota bacterium]